MRTPCNVNQIKSPKNFNEFEQDSFASKRHAKDEKVFFFFGKIVFIFTCWHHEVDDGISVCLLVVKKTRKNSFTNIPTVRCFLHFHSILQWIFN